MGDPKKIRKKYNVPVHPWQKESIERERKLANKYGLKNKKELWKMGSILANFKDQAKRLIALTTKQAEKEKKQLFQRLQSYGLLSKEASLDEVLSLELEQIMERRLQSFVLNLGLAKSIKQARQFITHTHILINDKKVTSPSYLVKKSEEHAIKFHPHSKLSDPEHPERKEDEEELPKKPQKKEEKKTKKETKKGPKSKPQKQEKETKKEVKGEKKKKKQEKKETQKEKKKTENKDKKESKEK